MLREGFDKRIGRERMISSFAFNKTFNRTLAHSLVSDK